jgi:uncharacterized protein
MRRPVHFEIHAENPERAAKFYAELFDWEIKKWDGPVDYWLVMTSGDDPDAPGIDGAIMKRMGANPDPKDPTPVIGYICSVDVEDVDATQAKAEKLGATMAVPKMPIQGVGWLVYLKDTESNIFGITQADTAAQ